MRAYVTSLSGNQIMASIKERGFGTAQHIQGQSGFVAGQMASFSTEAGQLWQHAKISYPLWYGDYGGTAPIDFYLRDAGRYRLVMVFMGWGEPNEAGSILNSVTIPTQ